MTTRAKHQLDCYRIINGQRYINAGDVLDEVMENYLARAKALKIPHRVFKHPDGFRRVFVLESRLNSLAISSMTWKPPATAFPMATEWPLPLKSRA